jgi:DNA polymerase III subunit delta'
VSPLPPREQGVLFGHAGAEATFLSSALRGRLHHAWLLTGPDGVGKETLAFRIGRWLLSGAKGHDLAIDPTGPVFRQVAAGSHPDLLTVARTYDDKRERQRDEIVADDVRQVGSFLHRTAADGGWRVVVLDGAEYMNRNAANALLKLLEEPPVRAILFLICASPGRLLPTIRSRCRLLRLAPLGSEAMEAALDHLLPEESTASRLQLASDAHGCPGRAVRLALDATASLRADARRVVETGAPGGAASYDLADAVLKAPDGFQAFLSQLSESLAEVIRRAASNDSNNPAFLGARALPDWIEIWQQIRSLRDDTLRFNLDRRQALLSGLALLSGS